MRTWKYLTPPAVRVGSLCSLDGTEQVCSKMLASLGLKVACCLLEGTSFVGNGSLPMLPKLPKSRALSQETWTSPDARCERACLSLSPAARSPNPVLRHSWRQHRRSVWHMPQLFRHFIDSSMISRLLLVTHTGQVQVKEGQEENFLEAPTCHWPLAIA